MLSFRSLQYVSKCDIKTLHKLPPLGEVSKKDGVDRFSAHVVETVFNFKGSFF